MTNSTWTCGGGVVEGRRRGREGICIGLDGRGRGVQSGDRGGLYSSDGEENERDI